MITLNFFSLRYQRAELLNTQLQQVSEDLKGVIEHINERNKGQDTSDPVSYYVFILKFTTIRFRTLEVFQR